jgi:diketogulonate reductase-like aldo/keto reductase
VTSAQASIGRLGVPHLNLALLHWPAAARIPPSDPRNAQLRLESWRALLQAQRRSMLLRVQSFSLQEIF